MAQYPNFPTGHIYDYGRDGTDISIRSDTAVITTYGTTEADALQRVSPDGGDILAWGNAYINLLVLMFPQPRTITGFMNGFYQSSGTVTVEYSSDTTNGHDGTWALLQSGPCANVSSIHARTSRLTTTSLTGVTAIRFDTSVSGTGYMRYLVLWTTDDIGGLTPWHPTNDESLSNDLLNLDRGDVFLNAAPVTQTFRFKNTHGTQTANDVVVSADVGKGPGQLGPEVRFSLDNATFTTSVTIPSIAPGAISPLIYMQRPLITDPAGTTRGALVAAKATSWS